jgi:hypothetical protein
MKREIKAWQVVRSRRPGEHRTRSRRKNARREEYGTDQDGHNILIVPINIQNAPHFTQSHGPTSESSPANDPRCLVRSISYHQNRSPDGTKHCAAMKLARVLHARITWRSRLITTKDKLLCTNQMCSCELLLLRSRRRPNINPPMP